MLKALALPLFCTFLVLLAVILLHRNRTRFAGHLLLYRVVFSALAASLCPTLALAGHGGLPLPTITGAVIAVMRLESINDLHLTPVFFGSKDIEILILPFVISFILIFAISWSKSNDRPSSKH